MKEVLAFVSITLIIATTFAIGSDVCARFLTKKEYFTVYFLNTKHINNVELLQDKDGILPVLTNTNNLDKHNIGVKAYSHISFQKDDLMYKGKIEKITVVRLFIKDDEGFYYAFFESKQDYEKFMRRVLTRKN